MAVANFMYGLVLIIIGVFLMKYNFKVTNLFSRYNWFEQKLGPGSTYIIFQLVAGSVVVLGILMMFGLGDNVVDFIFSPIRDIFTL